MKFASKIFVGIAAVALLISCLAFGASAEAPVLPTDDINDVLEYRLCDTYLAEVYNGQEGEYQFDGTDSVFSFETNDKAAGTIVSESENGVLLITNNSNPAVGVGYKMFAENEDDFLGLLAMSFDFKTGDVNGNNGSDFMVRVTLNDYIENIVLFGVNASDDSAKTFTYAEYDSERIIYNEKTAEGVAPELGVWYHVDIVCDLVNGFYSLSVESQNKTIISVSDEIEKSAGIDSARLYVFDGKDAGVTKTYFDNVTAYEGSFPRNVIDSENELADFIIAIDSYARYDGTSIEEKIKVAELYKELFGEDGIAYTAPENIKEYEKVSKIVSSAEALENQIYAEALVEFSGKILSVPDLYDKIDYRDEYAKPYYEMFPDTIEELNAIAGMTEKYSGEETYAAAVIKAKKVYNDACDKIKEIQLFSEEFVKEIEEGYDLSSKDYNHIKAKYGKLSLLVSKVDVTYRYNVANPDTKYPTVADAMLVYEALETKYREIEANVALFVPAVKAMNITQVDSVSSEAPFLTKNFEVLYDNYLKAKSVYSERSVHNALDPKTYPGLVEMIELYEVYSAYVEARAAECVKFINIVNGANSATYYKTLVEQLAEASLYLDSNKEKVLDKYNGVEDAIALYNTLVAKSVNIAKAAQDYVAAANAIDINATYSLLKSAVDNALTLKDAGAVMGIDGVEEANVKVAAAEAKVATIEGCSSTLISSVNSLKDAKTLMERRELIFIANSVKDNADDAISGVSAAKAELASQIQKYNSDVAAANALFATAVEKTCGTVASVAPTTPLVNISSVVAVLVK
jgi:hypothetical protein